MRGIWVAVAAGLMLTAACAAPAGGGTPSASASASSSSPSSDAAGIWASVVAQTIEDDVDVLAGFEQKCSDPSAATAAAAVCRDMVGDLVYIGQKWARTVLRTGDVAGETPPELQDKVGRLGSAGNDLWRLADGLPATCPSAGCTEWPALVEAAAEMQKAIDAWVPDA